MPASHESHNHRNPDDSALGYGTGSDRDRVLANTPLRRNRVATASHSAPAEHLFRNLNSPDCVAARNSINDLHSFGDLTEHGVAAI